MEWEEEKKKEKLEMRPNSTRSSPTRSGSTQSAWVTSGPFQMTPGSEDLPSVLFCTKDLFLLETLFDFHIRNGLTRFRGFGDGFHGLSSQLEMGIWDLGFLG